MNGSAHRCAGLDPVQSRRLWALLTANNWFMRALEAVAASGLPDAWIGAGAVRDVVWGHLYGEFSSAEVHDIDVAYFDPANLGMEGDLAAQGSLCALAALPWEATNQAAVHTWYHCHFGGPPVEPFGTVHEAIATWPETATCVAVRLRAGPDLEVCAPYGLDDLLGGTWRPNPVRVTPEVSMARLARQRVRARWPGVAIVLPR